MDLKKICIETVGFNQLECLDPQDDTPNFNSIVICL